MRAWRASGLRWLDANATARERLRRLAWLLDSSIPIPGTGWSIGIDALIGLFPVLGDLVGVALSSYILVEAGRLGAGKAVLARMALNIGLEGLAGLVPFLGDVFDAAFKANQRNVRLLDAWLARPRATARASLGLLVGLALAPVAVVILVVALLAFLIGS